MPLQERPEPFTILNDMPNVRAPDLLERLREVYRDDDGKTLSDEKLAGRLPISLSTFNRWKKGDTKAFRDTVAMLETAGWISIDGEAPAQVSSPDRLEELSTLVEAQGAAMTRSLDELARDVRKLMRQKSVEGGSASRKAVPR